ncbi:hypothetical protein PX690_21310 [Bacillus velezensis]|uniref:hypothetical protein n=1 Tax=Bacillus velezensis TaxID=492670 RepID=UPI0023E09E5B|nr:hypothetical protein [Bacillus velezensis]WES02015.1 hypothetical protein PX690_21310 [Bacillus velezensis]
MNEKAKLSEQISMLRESNAKIEANLNSKEADLENNVARMNELTRELTDVHSELMGKTQQLAISLAQPREDPELSSPEFFYKELQRYVDSKEKSTKEKGKTSEKKKEKKTMEFWPLIKVVRIFVKADALST